MNQVFIMVKKTSIFPINSALEINTVYDHKQNLKIQDI